MNWTSQQGDVALIFCSENMPTGIFSTFSTGISAENWPTTGARSAGLLSEKN